MVTTGVQPVGTVTLVQGYQPHATDITTNELLFETVYVDENEYTEVNVFGEPDIVTDGGLRSATAPRDWYVAP